MSKHKLNVKRALEMSTRFSSQRLFPIMIQYNLYYISLTLLFQENLNGTTTFGATCQEYFQRGSRRNGTYSIRPDLSRKEIQF